MHLNKNKYVIYICGMLIMLSSMELYFLVVSFLEGDLKIKKFAGYIANNHLIVLMALSALISSFLLFFNLSIGWAVSFAASFIYIIEYGIIIYDVDDVYSNDKIFYFVNSIILMLWLSIFLLLNKREILTKYCINSKKYLLGAILIAIYIIDRFRN